MGIEQFQVGALVVIGIGLALTTFGFCSLNVKAKANKGVPPKVLPYAGESKHLRRNHRNINLLIFTAWAFGFATNFLRVAQLGRPDRIYVSRVQEVSALASLSVKLFLVLFAAVAIFIIFDNIKTESKSASLFYLVLLLLPFIALTLSDRANSQPPAIDAILYPLAVFALWRAKTPFRSLAVVGWLTVFSAAASIAMGVLVPLIGTTLSPAVGDKSLWPTLLAGPYSHSNVLGLALSLGVPLIFLIRNVGLRWIGLLITLFAIGWSGNRGSIIAAAVAIIVYLIVRRLPRARLIPFLIGTAATTLLVVVPLSTDDPEAFSLRGRIWQASLEYFEKSPWLGNGTNFYGLVGRYVNNFGEQAFNGHNAFIHLLTTGGILTVVAVAAVLIANYVRAGVRVGRDRAIALSFVLMLITNSLLQNTITYTGLSVVAYCGWIVLAVLLFAPNALSAPTSSPGEAEHFASTLAKSTRQ